MTEQNYSKRELDEKFATLTDKLEDNAHRTRSKIQEMTSLLELRFVTSDKEQRESLQRIEMTQTEHGNKLDFTNGKVRKIIMALILVFGILIGLGFTELKIVLPLLGI